MNRNQLLEFFKSNPTISITIFSALCWYCAFYFEKGYCSHFGIPEMYIEIAVIDLIKFASALIAGTSLLIINLHDLFDNHRWKSSNYLSSLLKIGLIAFFIYIFLQSTFGNIKPRHLLYFLTLVVFVTLIYTLIYFLNKKAKMQNKDRIVLRVPENAKTQILLLFILAIILFPSLCYVIGYGRATKQEYFDVLAKDPNFVVLKRYGDNIICKDFNKKLQNMGDSLMVIKMGPMQPLKTSHKKLRTVDNPF